MQSLAQNQQPASASNAPDLDQEPFKPEKGKNVDRALDCGRFGKFYRLIGSGLWVSKDVAGPNAHGKVFWKIFKKQGRYFEHEFEADEFLNPINKHKSDW